MFLYENELNMIKETMLREGVIAKFQEADLEGMRYLRESQYPEDIINFFQYSEPSEGLEINGARLWPIKDLKEENEDAVPGYIIFRNGFRVIGSTFIGDSYCISTYDNRDGKHSIIYLASHDDIHDDYPDERNIEYVAEIAGSFREFLKLFAGGQLPTDYHDL